MEIQLLYFDDCPSWQKALSNLRTVLKEMDLNIEINLREVKSDKEAQETKFLGSPSFQLNGQDFWHEERQSYWMNCRVYITPEGLKGWPTIEMFRQKLVELITDKENIK
jgi:hypothetical protein